jgi:hypothetical protein
MSPAGYWRDISAILGLKALAIGLIYLLFFASPGGAGTNPSAVFQHLIAPPASSAGAGHD